MDEIEDPLVKALDGRWGAGKTYFLKRWVGAHRLQNEGQANTVYFDAFAHDYMSDPLTSLVAAISDRIPKTDATKLARVRTAAFKIGRPLARIGLSMATFGAKEALNDLGDAIAGSVGAEAAAAAEQFWQREADRQAAMVEFGAALQALMQSSETDGVDNGTPLVVVIDELDRCRPDFALEVLEVIKHFFSVAGVHFILGVNLRALGNSVEARYGSGVHSEGYLRKFIGLQLSLPTELGNVDRSRSASIVYLEDLVMKMAVPEHLASPLKEHLKLVSRSNDVSFRDVGKIVSSVNLMSVAVREGAIRYKGLTDVLVTLAVAKTIKPELYARFRDSEISSDQVLEYFGSSSEKMPPYVDGDRNPSLDREAATIYWSWMYLTGEEAFNEQQDGFRNAIKKRFDDWGDHSNPARIPFQIERDCLDLFSFYGN